MVDDAVASILQSKLEELSDSVRIMRDANIHQERNRIHAPSAYDEMFHAVGIAAYIQGIYTNTESLLKQALEITDGKIPKGDSWHQDLIRLAGRRIDGVRVAFLDAEGMKTQTGKFRRAIRGTKI